MSKGSAPRKGRDDKAFAAGYDRIFGGAGVMTAEKWVDRCAERYRTMGGLNAVDSVTAAEVQFQCCCVEFGKPVEPSGWPIPEEAADEDISYWADA
jgi:hypothetical protein